MMEHRWTAIVTIVALLVYFYMSLQVGRARGKRFIALSGAERIVYDQNLAYVEEESAKHKRKDEGGDD
jgi:uncharacterized membrane protein